MNDKATIRKVPGGYILEVRWPFAGTPLAGGELVCSTFDEAVTALYKHLHDDLPIGSTCVVEKKRGGR